MFSFHNKMCLKNKRPSSVNLQSYEFSMRKKKRSWFCLVKSLFVSVPNSKAEKKSKGWTCVLGGVKPNKYSTIAAPQRLINQAREEQRKQAVAVAIATAAAAHAAVAAARAAAEVVQLTGIPQSLQEYENRIRNSAATKIQAAYRAHLARKALKALKGLVKLQAMVRGRIVRRRVITKLKCFPPVSKSQSQVPEVRVQNQRFKEDERKQFLSPKEELAERNTKLRCQSQKNWDYRLFPKEDIEKALWPQKQEAIAKRECMKKYSYSHRERRNDQMVEAGKWSYQLDQRVESEAWKRRELKPTVCSNPMSIGMYGATQMMKQRNLPKQDSPVGDLNTPFTLPRRSFSHAKHKSIGDETSLPNSPIFPTYLAATESTKAKERSMSMPKQRHGFFDTYAGHNSPYKLRQSSWSSFNGEFIGKNGGGKPISSGHISLGMKGFY